MKLFPLTISSLLLTCFACVEIQTFPDNGAPAIYQASDFAALSTHPDLQKSHLVRIAEGMAGIEQGDHGFLIIAEWMLFPKNPNLRPENFRTDVQSKSNINNSRFIVSYSGIIESDFLWEGNEFLAIGKVTGTQEFIDIVGSSRSVPFLEARCLHVWQTGSADLSEYTQADPPTFRYPPPRERTYCTTPTTTTSTSPTTQSGH